MKQGHIFTRKVREIDEVAWLQFSDLAKRIIEKAEVQVAFEATDERVGEVNKLPDGVPRELFSGLEFYRVGEAGSSVFVQVFGPRSNGATISAAIGLALQYATPSAFTWKLEGIGAESLMGGADLFDKVIKTHIAVGGELDDVKAYFGDEATAYGEEMKRKGQKPTLANPSGARRFGSRETPRDLGNLLSSVLDMLSDGSPEDLKLQMEATEEAMQDTIDFDKNWGSMPVELQEETRRVMSEVGGKEEDMCASVAHAVYDNTSNKDPLGLMGTDERGASVYVDISHLPLSKFNLEERQDWVRRYIRTFFSKGATRVYFVSKGQTGNGAGVAASLYKPGQGHVLTASVYLDEEGEVIRGRAGLVSEGYLEMGASN